MGVSGHLRLRLPAALSKILGQRGVHDFHEFPYKLVSWECWTHLSSQNHDISKGWVATTLICLPALNLCEGWPKAVKVCTSLQTPVLAPKRMRNSVQAQFKPSPSCLALPLLPSRATSLRLQTGTCRVLAGYL